MEKIVFRTDTGIAVITPSLSGGLKLIGKLKKTYTAEDWQDALKAIIEKDVHRVFQGRVIPWIMPNPDRPHPDEMSLDKYMALPLAEYKIVDDSELPKDRVFRNAWNYDLKEDIPKSKEIWKDKLRDERKPLLEAQDIAFMQALENGNGTADIKTEKQRLRDVPQLVDSCKTISAIKKVTV